MSLKMEKKRKTFKDYLRSRNDRTLSLNGMEQREELMTTEF